MKLIYSIITTLIALAVYPMALFLALIGKPSLLSRQRSPHIPDKNGRQRLWIHAASVGEVGIALSFAEEAKTSNPNLSIVISTITTTGLERVKKSMASTGESYIDGAFLAPMDSPWVVGAFVKHIAPTSCVLVETEIWPSLINSLTAQKIPVTLVNARLSKRAFRRYMMARGLMRQTVRHLSLVCAQSRVFSRRFMMLGVPPERVDVLGNIKFDSLPQPEAFDSSKLRKAFGIPQATKLIVAGSTRPGEEDVLVRAFADVSERVPNAVLMLVPRHMKRLNEIEQILSELGIPYVKRTSGESVDFQGSRVLILDTMGELINAYACADIAFIGGSLRDFGGHNPLEAAALGKPVLFGPYMEQIGSKELLSKGAASLIHTVSDTSAVIQELLSNADRRAAMGDAGIAVVQSLRGTLKRTLRCMYDRRIL